MLVSKLEQGEDMALSASKLELKSTRRKAKTIIELALTESGADLVSAGKDGDEKKIWTSELRSI